MPSCSVGEPKTVILMGPCDLIQFKSYIRSQPQRARSKTKLHEAGEILALTTRHLLSSAISKGEGGGWGVVRWKTPSRKPTKWLLANGIKKYQNISKNFKNCQAWQMHKAGFPSICRTALCSRRFVLEARPLPLPSEDTQNWQRQ